MVEEIFKLKKANIQKLKEYGFKKNGENFEYKINILDNQFSLFVCIDNSGRVRTKLIDVNSQDEYILHLAGGVGEFVGKVRLEFEKVLKDICNKCFDNDTYQFEQTKQIIKFIYERFGDKLEYLWDKFPTDAIWRRKDNKKWYGLIMTIPKSKLGFKEDGIVEILDLRINPENMDKIVDGKFVFKGYHMNKKHWITIILDGSVEIDKILNLIEKSYELAI